MIFSELIELNRSWNMKRSVILLAMSVIFAFCLIACGGGSSSSDVDFAPNTSSSPPTIPPEPLGPSEQFSSLSINPIADLGLITGDNVCFSVKSYNNIAVSDFSKTICSKVSNSNELTLSWNKITGDNISGYYVYFGTNKNNATNFLADIIES